MNQPLIIAHRGASTLAPENTLSAVNLAWQIGARAVEIDVRLTRDRQIVAIHDANTWRLTRHFGYIRRRSLEQLRQLDFGRHKGSEWQGESIATLPQILDNLPQGKKLFIEIKGLPLIVPFLARLFKMFSFHNEQINFLAFNKRTLAAAKEYFPHKAVYMLYEYRLRRPRPVYFLRKIITAHLDGLDISASQAVNRRLVEAIQKEGKKLLVWTVDDAQEAKRLAALGVDGITTNRPAWLKEQLCPNGYND